MPVPDYQTLMRPLLVYGQDGSEKNIREAINAIADQFHLTEQERGQMLPSGKQTLLSNRVHWARTYLDKAGALKRTRRSHFIVTDRGRELLQKYPQRIGVGTLKQFPEFIAFQPKKPDSETLVTIDAAPLNPGTIPFDQAASQTPEEAIQGAEEEIAENLRSQLLDRIFGLSPAFFE